MNANNLCSLITTLPVPQPVTNAFEVRWPATGRVWYTSQKEHLLGWLGDYHTPGAYSPQYLSLPQPGIKVPVSTPFTPKHPTTPVTPLPARDVYDATCDMVRVVGRHSVV